MRKRILCLIMAVLMMFGMAMTVSAEDFYGNPDWEMVFDGSKIDTNFTGEDMAQDILSIQPGDSITLQIKLKNTSNKKADWYMTNEVIRSLEDGSDAAKGGAYTYILKYVDPEGIETVLFNSDVVGGEKEDSAEEEGLHEATNGMEDHFYLDRTLTGEEAYISLYVKLDGETQGNAYQGTLATVQMNFAVEKVNDETITTQVTKEIIEEKIVIITNVVKTGDTNPILLFSVAALISGVALLVLVWVLVQRRRQEKGELQG